MLQISRIISSPLGPVEIEISSNPERTGVVAVRFVEEVAPEEDAPEENAPEQSEFPEHPLLDSAARQLGEYFGGTRTTFDLPLTPAGTDFQQRVWAVLGTIPYGQITSYGSIAQELGDPKTVRAVGAANGANPIAIIVPCHRVLGADGKLIGYAGGLHRKEWLLRHEGALLI